MPVLNWPGTGIFIWADKCLRVSTMVHVHPYKTNAALRVFNLYGAVLFPAAGSEQYAEDEDIPRVVSRSCPVGRIADAAQAPHYRWRKIRTRIKRKTRLKTGKIKSGRIKLVKTRPGRSGSAQPRGANELYPGVGEFSARRRRRLGDCRAQPAADHGRQSLD